MALCIRRSETFHTAQVIETQNVFMFVWYFFSKIENAKTVWMHTTHTTTCVGVVGAGVQPHPQKFWFGKNPGKIIWNQGKICWNFGKICWNLGKICWNFGKMQYVWKHSHNRCVCFDFTKNGSQSESGDVYSFFLDVIFFHIPKILPDHVVVRCSSIRIQIWPHQLGFDTVEAERCVRSWDMRPIWVWKPLPQVWHPWKRGVVTPLSARAIRTWPFSFSVL